MRQVTVGPLWAASGGARLSTGREIPLCPVALPSLFAGGGLHRRVALPSEPQYEWEMPRLGERPLGGATNGISARLVRLGSAGAIKAFGNSILPQIAFVIFELMKAFSYDE